MNHRRNSSRIAGFACVFLIAAFLPVLSRAQEAGILPIEHPIHQFLERQQVSGVLEGAFLMHRPLSAYEARRYLDSVAVRAEELSARDRALLERYRGQRPAPGAAWVQRHVSFLYENGTDFFSTSGEGYLLTANPSVYLAGGGAWRDQPGHAADRVGTFRNTRGARVAGHIGPYVFFNARVEENQVREPFVRSTGFTAPRVGYTKTWERGTLDHFTATGVVGARSRFFEVRAGRERNRWADGRTSLILSDYAPYYDHLQIRTTVWRLQYTNIFARFTDRTGIDPLDHNRTLPRKHGAFHQLAIDLPGRVQVALFESVVFAPDSIRGPGFDAAYLNPFIFLRPVEHDMGSPDNMMIGASASWIAMRGVKLYGQGFLTELRLEELIAGNGWYGNKYGVLGGVHLVDRPLEGLSLRLEASKVRPYAYSHFDPATAFVHYEDVLGHPAGQNVIDYAVFAEYEPALRWRLAMNVARTFRARDLDGENWGNDPRHSYHDAAHRYDVRMLHGIRVDDWLVEAHAGYELLPRMYLEAAMRIEHSFDHERGTQQFIEPVLQLRWGLPYASRRW